MDPHPTLPPTPPIEEMVSAYIDTPPFRAGPQAPKMLAALSAARAAGWAMVQVALIEEAAAYIAAGPYEGEPTADDLNMAAALRQAAGKGEAT